MKETLVQVKRFCWISPELTQSNSISTVESCTKNLEQLVALLLEIRNFTGAILLCWLRSSTFLQRHQGQAAGHNGRVSPKAICNMILPASNQDKTFISAMKLLSDPCLLISLMFEYIKNLSNEVGIFKMLL